ncbi:LPS O-antigen chain length determinant protein, WzzB/FepE family [Aquiflexum balticum DSM 16537]|uniref:LPS O-antigen chain length determinant protein, WzzB/FepE family n=1 Tax=Aquiflexum balticum DSM 16537 TaxID=758820 RepID=A0A1W2H6P1_9BACT|nr:Wzz/FepE/Etk N-terminal domain-containing protein [Aquiflexum balticum]SMD44617.1 LPS O-antigen chain length determinant protein, WzzB/FepE family [Aquiflexum balticum DSM 16537]
MEKPKNPTSSNNDEIDLLELAKTAWDQKKLIISITVVVTILGVLIALVLKNEYTAGSTFVPQTTEKANIGGNLGGLASLAGINLGGLSGGSEIPPSLYPKIVSSVNFRKDLLNATFYFQGNSQPITYEYYYDSVYQLGLIPLIRKYTIGLPSLLIKNFKANKYNNNSSNDFGLINISEKEFEHFKRLDKQISIQYNEKEGFVSLSFAMPEPLMAAQMAKYAEELLQKEVIEFKIQNAREQLKYTEERFEEKKIEFEEIQKKLANFRDKNQNLSSALVLNQLEKLESEYNFAFNIYTELAKQLEQAKLQVSKDTPIFSIIQPVTIPIEKSAPKRPMIVIVFLFLGLIVAFGYIFGREFLIGLKEQWNIKKLERLS